MTGFKKEPVSTQIRSTDKSNEKLKGKKMTPRSMSGDSRMRNRWLDAAP